jgi:hypothetical protein
MRLLLLIIVAIVPTGALAQFDVSPLMGSGVGSLNTNFSDLLDPATQQQLTIDTRPLVPAPNEVFEAQISDFGPLTSGAAITWQVDGEVVETTGNQREITLTAPDVNESMTLTATINGPTGGAPIVLERIFNPVYLDIVLEPQTRTPGWYQGGALPSPYSLVNVTAVVNGGAIDPSSLTYDWVLNQDHLTDGPLLGNYRTNFTAPPRQRFSLQVIVSDPSGEVIANRTFQLRSTSPTLSFYQRRANGTILPRVFDSYLISGLGSTFIAEPFHLDTRTYNNPDILTWELAGDIYTPESGNPYELEISRQGFGGRTSIEFHVRNRETLQGSKSSFTVEY